MPRAAVCVPSRTRRKYEEIHPPAVDEFVYISDNTYTREEVRSPPPRARARPLSEPRARSSRLEPLRLRALLRPPRQILRMEAGILNKLDFVLTVATPKVFLKRYFRVASISAAATDKTNILAQVRSPPALAGAEPDWAGPCAKPACRAQLTARGRPRPCARSTCAS